jgi:crotonobetainyl-CoA:carnitine CoA-transferase CaiB-like acyl-CoA transferase
MGITFYTGYRGDKPWKVGQSYPDFIACWAGLNGLWAAIAHMRKTGQGQWIDVGMYQLGASLMPEPLLQKQLDGTEPVRMGNEHAEYVPSNLYQVAGEDQWLALTIQTDQQWEALTTLMQQPHLALDERYRTNEVRRANRDSINTLVEGWCRSQNAKALLEKLQARGIAAGIVLNSRDLLHDPHLKHRQFYETVQHPEPIGARPIISRPYKLRFRDAHIKKPGPRFGEDNDNILREILGKNPAQIAALKASNVLSDVPTNPGISGTMDTTSMLALKTLIAVDQDYRTE